MRIEIASGVGSGPTELAAFDAALIAAGVANFNLLVLSSVIPPASEIVESEERLNPDGEWGDRLYVVMAQEQVTTRNTEAWAGLGWARDEGSGRGLFVEHHGGSRAEVEGDIDDSPPRSARTAASTRAPPDAARQHHLPRRRGVRARRRHLPHGQLAVTASGVIAGLLLIGLTRPTWFRPSALKPGPSRSVGHLGHARSLWRTVKCRCRWRCRGDRAERDGRKPDRDLRRRSA